MELGVWGRLTNLSFMVFLFIMFGLPSAAFTYVKYFSLMCLMFFLAMYIAWKQGKIMASSEILVALLLILVSVTFTLLVSTLRGHVNIDAFYELRSFLIIVLEIGIASILFTNKIVRWHKVARVFVLSLIFFGCLKLLTLLILFSFPSTGEIISDLLFPDAFRGGYILFRGFYRMVAVNDYYLPVAYIITGLRSFSPKEEIAYKVIILFFVFLTFSRFLWIEMIFCVMLDFFSKSNSRKFLQVGLIIGIFLLFIGLLGQIAGADVAGTLNLRFGAEGALSISEKANQGKALMMEFYRFPVIGKGLGTYVESYLPPYAKVTGYLNYSYEIFILLLLMQFGLFGFLLLGLGIFWPILVSKNGLKKKTIAFFAVSFFLSAGLTNPVILNAPTGLLLSLWYMFCEQGEL